LQVNTKSLLDKHQNGSYISAKGRDVM